MTEIETLKGKIDKMQRGIASGNIPEAQLPNMKIALQKAQVDLAALEKAGNSSKPEVSRQDIYTALLNKHSDLTQSGVLALSSKDYDKLHDIILNEIQQGFGERSDANEIAEVFLNSKLPEGVGKKSEPKPKAAKTKTVVKPPKEKVKKQGISNELVTYNWLSKIPGFESARRIRFNTDEDIRLIVPDKEVFIKHRDGTVAVQPGEGILLIDGYPFTFLTQNGLDRIKPYEAMVTKSTHDLAIGRIKVLEDRIGKVVKGAKAAKASFAKKEPPTPPAPKMGDIDKPAPIKDKPKRHSWSREHGNVVRLTSSFYEFLKEHNWTGAIKAKDVLKVVYTTGGERAYFFVQTKHYGILKNRIEWHKICPESWKFGEKLDTKDFPKLGSYKLLLTESEIKKAKTTKGPEMYSQCLNTYRKFHECSQDGSCNKDDREKIKQAWHTCGDLTLKTDKMPAWMTMLHDEVRANQKKEGGTYLEAMKRVTEQLKG